MLLLLFFGAGPGTPLPPVVNYDQYLYGTLAPDGPLSGDTDQIETASSTLSQRVDGYESHGQTLRTDI